MFDRPLRGPENRRIDARLLVDGEHYDELIARELPQAKVSLWIATANLKELRVEAPIGTRARAKGRFVSVLETLAALVDRGVELRILHGCPPSRPFRAALAKQPELVRAKVLRECPRVHLKLFAIDGRLLYLGSANFTGAGIGARGAGRRNFELGLLTSDDHALDVAQARFDSIWSGRECGSCKLRRDCPKPLDLATRTPAKLRSARGARARPPAPSE
jgi:phosphatidylserine/phosphatidylglycerophosphate/cardiolipin synthase-like enzyme